MSDPRALEPRIEERIRDFDVSALLLLLAEIAPDVPYALRRAGYPASAPRPSWLEAITFGPKDAPPSAAVAANLGLSSCRAPLPDYFRELSRDPDVNGALGELLSVLDDRLLERRFASYRPEGDPGIFPSFPGTRRDVLCLGALRSPAALHWLFHKIYPELRVNVRRLPQAHTMPAPDARLGAASLGLAALGGRAVVPVRALEVRLVCHDHLSPHLGAAGVRAHWAALAAERLRAHVFPVLRGAGVHLTVWLLVLDDEARARLRDAELPEPSYLGYEPLRRTRVRFRVRLRLRRGAAVRRVRRPRRFRPLRRSPRAVSRTRVNRLFAPPPPARVLIFAGPVPEMAEGDGAR